MANAQSIINIFNSISLKCVETLEFYEKEHAVYFTQLADMVPLLKKKLDEDDVALLSKPGDVNKYVSRKKSNVRKKAKSIGGKKSMPNTPEIRKSISTRSSVTRQSISTRLSRSQKKSLEKTVPVAEIVSIPESCDETPVLNSAKPQLVVNSAKVSEESLNNLVQSGHNLSNEKSWETANSITPCKKQPIPASKLSTTGPVKVPALTKASKHKNRRSKSNVAQTSKDAPSSEKKQNRMEVNSAAVKKQALLKAKVEKQKKQREQKAEKIQNARLLIEKEREMKALEIAKKGELPSKKTADMEIIKKQQFGEPSQHYDNVEAAAKKAKVCQESQQPPKAHSSGENQKALLNTTVTICEGEKDMSYTDYEISPLRNSDSEEDNEPTKPVPKWASGLRLKEALLKQFYNPPNTVDIFGRIHINPKETFGVNMKKLPSRNSSAIWTTPDQSFMNF